MNVPQGIGQRQRIVYFRYVKRIAAYLLLGYFGIASFIPHSDFSQLQKVPDIYTHYQQHRSETRHDMQSLTFIEFIKAHYLSEISHEHDDFDHDKLPFYHCQNCLQLFVNDYQVFSCDDYQNWQQPDFNRRQLHYYHIYIKGVDQPPIIA